MSEQKLSSYGFPLEQWFDLAKPIRKSDADLCEAQMALYAVKDGEDPESPDARAIYQQMRLAVWQHNKRLTKAPPSSLSCENLLDRGQVALEPCDRVGIGTFVTVAFTNKTNKPLTFSAALVVDLCQ